MSRASFVCEGSVAWLTPSSCQTKHSYHRVQTCDARSHSSFVSVAPGQHNVICRCPQRHKGFWVQQHNVLAYLQVQAAFCHCDRVPSSTSSSTTSSGTRGSYAYIFGLCSAATQQGFTPSYFIGFCDNIVSTHTKVHRRKWSASVHCD